MRESLALMVSRRRRRIESLYDNSVENKWTVSGVNEGLENDGRLDICGNDRAMTGA